MSVKFTENIDMAKDIEFTTLRKRRSLRLAADYIQVCDLCGKENGHKNVEYHGFFVRRIPAGW
jgi:hypothetical protein